MVWNVWPVFRHSSSSSSSNSQHRHPPGALWHYYSIGSRRRPIPPPSPCPGRAVTRSHWHHTHSVFYTVLYWSRADSSELIKNSCEHKESKTYTRKKERRYNGNINTNSTVWEVARKSNKKERKTKKTETETKTKTIKIIPYFPNITMTLLLKDATILGTHHDYRSDRLQVSHRRQQQ